jgi:hypothetical protein
MSIDSVSGVGSQYDPVAEAMGQGEARAQETESVEEAPQQAEAQANQEPSAPPVDDKGGSIDQSV